MNKRDVFFQTEIKTRCRSIICVGVCASMQSSDGSEYTLQGPAGGDDLTGLSAEPAHYQILAELGKTHNIHLSLTGTVLNINNWHETKMCAIGRGFNNLSQVNMGRHIPTGQLVALKQTNLDECTEEELLQLMV